MARLSWKARMRVVPLLRQSPGGFAGAQGGHVLLAVGQDLGPDFGPVRARQGLHRRIFLEMRAHDAGDIARGQPGIPDATRDIRPCWDPTRTARASRTP